jgi:hypothetical protein
MSAEVPELRRALRAAQEIRQLIEPLLVGRSPKLQQAVLADLLANWLAGHFVPGDAVQTAKLRGDLVEMHLDYVHELTLLHANERGFL